MKSLLKLVLSACFLVAVQAGFAQADTLKKFVPEEMGPADKKLKNEIQQKQLLEKPIPLKSNTASKDAFKRKPVKKISGQQPKAKSK